MSQFTVLNPATEEPVTTVTQATAEQADEAIARAAAAQAAWRDVAPGDRARLLRSFAAVVDAHVSELADLEVAGSGHPVGQSRWEAEHVRDVLLYYSAAPERLCGQQIPVPGGLNVTFHEPVGVVGLIVPWNFPMPILSWGMAPALAAGNTVVAKPAEATPLTAMRIGELALEAGLPEGVLAVLPGKGSVVGQRLVDHPWCARSFSPGRPRWGSRSWPAARARSSGSRWNSAARAPTSSSPTPTWSGPRRPRRTRCSTTPGRTAARGPGSWCSTRSSTGSWSCSSPRCKGVAVGDPASAATEMGPLISAAHRAHVASYVPSGAPVAFRGQRA